MTQTLGDSTYTLSNTPLRVLAAGVGLALLVLLTSPWRRIVRGQGAPFLLGFVFAALAATACAWAAIAIGRPPPGASTCNDCGPSALFAFPLPVLLTTPACTVGAILVCLSTGSLFATWRAGVRLRPLRLLLALAPLGLFYPAVAQGAMLRSFSSLPVLDVEQGFTMQADHVHPVRARVWSTPGTDAGWTYEMPDAWRPTQAGPTEIVVTARRAGMTIVMRAHAKAVMEVGDPAFPLAVGSRWSYVMVETRRQTRLGWALGGHVDRKVDATSRTFLDVAAVEEKDGFEVFVVRRTDPDGSTQDYRVVAADGVLHLDRPDGPPFLETAPRGGRWLVSAAARRRVAGFRAVRAPLLPRAVARRRRDRPRARARGLRHRRRSRGESDGDPRHGDHRRPRRPRHRQTEPNARARAVHSRPALRSRDRAALQSRG